MNIDNDKIKKYVNILNGKYSCVDLFEKIAKSPETFYTKFTQFSILEKINAATLQSRQIRFGNSIQKCYEEIFNDFGYLSLNKNLISPSGEKLEADILLEKDNNIFLIEMKIADNHDADKKRSSNFENKLKALLKLHKNENIYATIFFVKNLDKNNKNKTHYQNNINYLRSTLNVNVCLSYEKDIFDFLNIQNGQAYIDKSLSMFDQTKEACFCLDFDVNYQETASQILNAFGKQKTSKYLFNMFNNKHTLEKVFPIIFPNGNALKELNQYCAKPSLANSIDKYCRSRNGI